MVKTNGANAVAHFIGSDGVGLLAHSTKNTAVSAFSTASTALIAETESAANIAAHFIGDVIVTGKLQNSGNGFTIDDPRKPTHRYLSHSSVESSDMKNIYDGVVVLNAQGEAEVSLPPWFDVLNTEFRYQLTPIGDSSPNLYIAKEIREKHFKIAGGKPHMKVCWQVTGIRQDAWAKAHHIPVEQNKPEPEQGYYLHPELYGEPKEKGILRGAYHSQLEAPVLPK